MERRLPSLPPLLMPLLLLLLVAQVKVACVAPSVRVAVSEEFGLEPGQVSIGQLVAGLRALGFDKVFDTNFTADLTVRPRGRQAGRQPGLRTDTAVGLGWLRWTSVLSPFVPPSQIMEEGSELLARLGKGKEAGPLPMFTSCCPGWVNLVEKSYPHLIPHLSTAKSPQGTTTEDQGGTDGARHHHDGGRAD